MIDLRALVSKQVEFVSDQPERELYVDKLKTDIRKLEEEVQQCAKTDARGVVYYNLEKEEGLENERFRKAMLLKYISSSSPYIRNRLIDYYLFSGKLTRGQRKSFRGQPSAKLFLDHHVQVKYEKFKPMIDSFFESDVMSGLLQQYREAMDIRRRTKKIFNKKYKPL